MLSLSKSAPKAVKGFIAIAVFASILAPVQMSQAQTQRVEARPPRPTEEVREREEAHEMLPSEALELDSNSEYTEQVPRTEWPLPGDMVMVCDDPDSAERCEVLDDDPVNDP